MGGGLCPLPAHLPLDIAGLIHSGNFCMLYRGSDAAQCCATRNFPTCNTLESAKAILLFFPLETCRTPPGLLTSRCPTPFRAEAMPFQHGRRGGHRVRLRRKRVGSIQQPNWIEFHDDKIVLLRNHAATVHKRSRISGGCTSIRRGERIFPHHH